MQNRHTIFRATMASNLTSLLIEIIVSAIIVSPILWLVGRALVGGQKAKFTDAIWIVALGVIINAILGMFIHGIVGIIVTLIVLLWLIRHFFDTGWLHAIIIAVAAIIALAVIVFILGALGFGVLANFISGVKLLISSSFTA
ncbi:MAG: hypothetical protein NTX81_03705 [Candidatus Bathyarchaeota archaeon]|nr:hypothetical protein [Candidatus Bathyarchaeota archaeon]